MTLLKNFAQFFLFIALGVGVGSGIFLIQQNYFASHDNSSLASSTTPTPGNNTLADQSASSSYQNSTFNISFPVPKDYLILPESNSTLADPLLSLRFLHRTNVSVQLEDANLTLDILGADATTQSSFAREASEVRHLLSQGAVFQNTTSDASLPGLIIYNYSTASGDTPQLYQLSKNGQTFFLFMGASSGNSGPDPEALLKSILSNPQATPDSTISPLLGQ